MKAYGLKTFPPLPHPHSGHLNPILLFLNTFVPKSAHVGQDAHEIITHVIIYVSDFIWIVEITIFQLNLTCALVEG